MLRSGSEYLSDLKASDVKIWYQGELRHPLSIEKLQFQAAAIADYYEQHQRDAELSTIQDLERISTTLMISMDKDDLIKKSRAYLSLARNYLGILGRAPDYINVVFSSWMGSPELFGSFQHNLENNYKNICDNDLFVTHSTAELKGGTDTGIRVVKETDAGIILSGARAMATSAALSDEIFIAPTRTSDQEPEKAIVCLVDTCTPGLNMVCRENFKHHSSISQYFDESDALISLEQVFVPWEKVLIYRDVELYNSVVTKTATSPACSLQTNARAIAKLETLISLGKSWTHIKDNNPGIQQGLSRALRDLNILKSLQKDAIESGKMVGSCFQPDPQVIETAKVFFMESYPQIIHAMRENLGAQLLYIFKPEDLPQAVVEQLSRQWGLENHHILQLQTHLLPLFDLLLSSFGSRHELYEQHFAGSPQRVKTNFWKSYEKHFSSERVLNLLKKDMGHWTRMMNASPSNQNSPEISSEL